MRLVPYHCLGSLWSQRDKKGREGVCWSVRATVRQFNKLANTVLASCLWPTGLRSQQRARLLEKWIGVAEVGARTHTHNSGGSESADGRTPLFSLKVFMSSRILAVHFPTINPH